MYYLQHFPVLEPTHCFGRPLEEGKKGIKHIPRCLDKKRMHQLEKRSPLSTCEPVTLLGDLSFYPAG